MDVLIYLGNVKEATDFQGGVLKKSVFFMGVNLV